MRTQRNMKLTKIIGVETFRLSPPQRLKTTHEQSVDRGEWMKNEASASQCLLLGKWSHVQKLLCTLCSRIPFLRMQITASRACAQPTRRYGPCTHVYEHRLNAIDVWTPVMICFTENITVFKKFRNQSRCIYACGVWRANQISGSWRLWPEMCTSYQTPHMRWDYSQQNSSGKPSVVRVGDNCSLPSSFLQKNTNFRSKIMIRYDFSRRCLSSFWEE